MNPEHQKALESALPCELYYITPWYAELYVLSLYRALERQGIVESEEKGEIVTFRRAA